LKVNNLKVDDLKVNDLKVGNMEVDERMLLRIQDCCIASWFCLSETLPG
jgi:hypothetical protein